MVNSVAFKVGTTNFDSSIIILRRCKGSKLYDKDDNTFACIDSTKKAYLIGFLFADSWITKDKRLLGMKLQAEDVEILELFSIQELYGFKFAKVKIRMVDYPNQIPFETVLLLDTIKSESPSLTYEESNRLYQEVLKDYEGETKFKQFQKVKANQYFNGLQVKFSYAITCHKSQGGQWNTVFIEQPYLPDGINRDYIRWLYTAMTRAKNKLYLIGFKDESFVE